MLVTHELSPIYDKDSQILILGSMPSTKSREIGFYYAHPSNRFWSIMAKLFHVTFNSIEQKINFLHKNHIALWDVFSSVEITGSSDASIKNGQLNDINSIIKKSNISVIFVTGKTAFNFLSKHYKSNLPIIYLPSPSSANASFNLDKLIKIYAQILNYIKK